MATMSHEKVPPTIANAGTTSDTSNVGVSATSDVTDPPKRPSGVSSALAIESSLGRHQGFVSLMLHSNPYQAPLLTLYQHGLNGADVEAARSHATPPRQLTARVATIRNQGHQTGNKRRY